MKTRREALKMLGGITLGGIMVGCTAAPTPTPVATERAAEKPVGAVVEKGVVAKPLLPAPSKRVVILGAGVGGAMSARTIRKLAPDIEVVLVERHPTYISGPSHTDYPLGIEDLSKITFGFDGLRRQGVTVIRATAMEIRPNENKVITSSGFIEYNSLLVAVGVMPIDSEIRGLAENSYHNHHTWEWERAILMRQALEEFKGGVFVISVPPAPYKCPPGPYETACLVREFWQKKGVQAEIVIVDANEQPQPPPLAERWKEVLAAQNIVYKPSFKVVEIDVEGKKVISDKGETQTYDLASIIPPQKAPPFIKDSGLDYPFIEVDPTTFQSKTYENIYALGDVAKLPYTKSAFTALLQAQNASFYIVRALGVDRGEPATTIFNQCWPYVSSQEAMLVEAAWAKDGKLIPERSKTEGPNAGHVQQRKEWEYGMLEAAYG